MSNDEKTEKKPSAAKKKKKDGELLSPGDKALLDIAMEIQGLDAKDANALGFMARAIILCSLPFTDPGKQREYTRRSGQFVLNIVSLDPDCPLPFGSIPRLALGWITTEAVRTQSPVIELGSSFTKFLTNLGLSNTGGKRGDATRLKDQCRRLFNCALFAGVVKDEGDLKKISSRRYLITDSSETLQWIDSSLKGQPSLWTDNIRLSEGFFREITSSPVPIDLRVLQALARSPLAMDLYLWSTYRQSHLDRPLLMDWQKLYVLFGGQFASVYDFKKSLKVALRKVLTVYPTLKAEIDSKKGVTLLPSPTHVPMTKKIAKKDPAPGNEG